MLPCYRVRYHCVHDMSYFVSQCIHALNYPYIGVDFFLEIFLWRLALINDAKQCASRTKAAKLWCACSQDFTKVTVYFDGLIKVRASLLWAAYPLLDSQSLTTAVKVRKSHHNSQVKH